MKSSCQHKISRQQQIKELNLRVPPILNVDVVLCRKGKVLIGKRNKDKVPAKLLKLRKYPYWLFPGGRVRYDENLQDAALRIIRDETPGIQANIRKIVTGVSDKGYDYRAYGVTIYMLAEYASGTPVPNDQLSDFKWMSVDELRKFDKFYDLDKSILGEVETAIITMNTSEDEILVEVDEQNKEIGTIIKRDAHFDPSRYHRAAHMMIFNSKGEVVLQQRSMTKSTGAGKWDMHGGHQVSGHTIEQTAMQELAEELGIHTDLTLKRIGLYQDERQSEYYYLYYGLSDGPYGFDRNEVEQIKAFDCRKLLKREYDKDHDVLEHVYNYVEELEHYWSKLK